MSYTVIDLGAEILRIDYLLDAATCAHIIQIAEHCQLTPAGILVNEVSPDVCSGGILTLDLKDPLQQSTNALLIGKIRIIQEALFRWYGIKFPQVEPCSILRYLPGQGYKRHVDNILLSSRVQEMQQGIPTRDVSLVGYLNDDFEGGETLFDRQHLKVQPQAGSVVIFPAYYTHPYQSLPVRMGKKYAWTSWLYH